MSKRNIYLLVISIITIFCIIAGSVIHLGNFNFFGFDIDDEGDFSNYIDLEDFNSIEIDGKVISVKITSSSDSNAGININCNKEKLFPEVSIKDHKLIINQTNTSPIHGNSNCNIFITVPSDMNLTDIDIELNVGEIDISDITSDNIDVTTNVGELNFENIIFQELEGKSNVGEITLDFDNISDVIDDFNISLSTNIGEVIIGHEKFKKSYNQKGETSKKIKLCTNVGEIKIK